MCTTHINKQTTQITHIYLPKIIGKCEAGNLFLEVERRSKAPTPFTHTLIFLRSIVRLKTRKNRVFCNVSKRKIVRKYCIICYYWNYLLELFVITGR